MWVSTSSSANPVSRKASLPPMLAATEFPDRLTTPILAGLGFSLWLATLAYFLSGHGLNDATGDPLGRDFANFWAAGHLTLSGQSAVIYDHDLIQQFYRATFGPLHGDYFLSYPPFFLFYLLPLGLLPYLPALLLWIAVSVGFYLVAALGRHPDRRDLAALLLSPATIICVFMCQTGLLAAGFMLAGLRQIDRRPHLAGLLFGLMAFKPQTTLLLPLALAASGRWRVIASAALTAALITAASFLLLDARDWPGYLAYNAPATADLELHGTGPLLYIEPSTMRALMLLGFPPSLGLAVQIAVAAGTAAIVWMLFRRVRFDRAIPLLLIGTCLIPPYIHNYDMTITAAGLLYFVRDPAHIDLPTGTRLLIALGWALPAIMMPLHYLGLPIAPLVLLILLIVAARRIGRDLEAPATP